MEYFKILPSDITLEILSRVPAESVLECKLVCGSWRNLVRRPSFSKMHLKHQLDRAGDSGKLGFVALTAEIKNNFQYFEYNENHESIDRIRSLNFNLPFRGHTIFVGSRNGLICVSQAYQGHKIYYICNPIRREYIMLPEMKGFKYCPETSGFGYVSSTDEYKVVRIVTNNHTKQIEGYVCTLGSGLGWRKLGDQSNFGTSGFSDEAIFANGTLYWLDYELQMIVPFDLSHEKFCKLLPLPSPPVDDLYGWYNYKLGVLDGCLSFVISRGKPYLEVWLFKNRNDNHCREEREEHQSLVWSEEFKVYENELFAVTKSRGVLTYNDNHINIRNFEASTSKRIVDFKEHFSGVFPHRNSFVSLKEIGEEDTKLMESVEIARTKSQGQPLNQL